ncbi:MAG: hypothetical protein IJ770_03180 [Alphaproteobacteria bacterium]|nr:hypothetical protein [Alphaproteobacteria bacterium]
MKFLHYLIILPFVAAAVWAVCCATSSEHGISFAPWKEYFINPHLVLACCTIFGYILGRIGAWFGYSPMRRDLRQQRKANRVLNKEQAKLNETVSGLKQDIVGLQEKAKNQAESSDKAKKSGWWRGFKGAKKG